MADAPATPVRAGDNSAAVKVAMPSLYGLSSSTKLHRSSVYEPSPASTYGETTLGDSSPVTPQEQAYTANLIASMRTAKLEDASGQDQNSPRVLGQDSGVKYAEVHGTNGFYKHQVLISTPSRGRISEPSTSSPSGSRLNEIRSSPTWRNSSGYMKQSAILGDDPFVAENELSEVTDNQPQFKPRFDRLNERIGPDNAQALLPPNACVFVANLQQAMTDEQLEYSVREVFQVFGNCYVKIRRDHKGMPYAFCQYETSEDAQRAIHLGRGMKVNNRECRTEVARVNRSLYLSNIAGGSITEDEARQVLAGYGDIERLWYCSPTDKEMFRLADGIWVMFAFFQDCRDAQTAFRDHPKYRLEQPKMPDDIRAALTCRNFSSPLNGRARSSLQSSPAYSSPQYGGRVPFGNRAVFVGNLPAGATMDMVKERLGAYGEIELAEVVEKPSSNINGVNTFAFVEFRTSEAASLAINSGTVMNGCRLRIEPKVDVQRHNQMFGGSPIRPPMFDQQDAMARLFQHGVSVGLAAAATQAQNVQAPIYGPYPFYQPPQYGAFSNQAMQHAAIENELPMALQHHAHAYTNQETGSYNHIQASPPTAFPQCNGYPLRGGFEWDHANHHTGEHDGQ